MRIGIVGAGALGGLFGAKLADSGADVTLIDTWADHVSAINDDGLCVHTPDSDQLMTQPTATADAEGIDPVDILFLMVKTDTTAAALKTATTMIDAETIVTSFQNGFTAHEMIPDRLEVGTFVSGTTRHGAQVVEPGKIDHDATGETIVGADNEAAERLAEILTSAGFETKAVDDIRPYLWDKQFVSIGIKPTAALTGHVNGSLIEYEAATTVLEKLVTEADRVREAWGVDAITSDPVAMVKEFCQNNPTHVSSALKDVRNHRKTEIKHINGAVARYGEATDVPVPYNRLVTELVTAKEQEYMSQTSRSNG